MKFNNVTGLLGCEGRHAPMFLKNMLPLSSGQARTNYRTM